MQYNAKPRQEHSVRYLTVYAVTDSRGSLVGVYESINSDIVEGYTVTNHRISEHVFAFPVPSSGLVAETEPNHARFARERGQD